MPYFLSDTSRAGEVCEREFEPELQIPEQSKPLLNGEVLTQEQKDALPRLLKIGKLPRKGLPDVFGWSGGGQWVICKKLKDQIEALEPGLHEFIPVEMKSIDGSKAYDTYFHLLYTVKLDAFVYDETEFTEGFGWDAAQRSQFRIRTRAKNLITLQSDVIAGHHLWRGALGRSVAHTYCSDELRDFIKTEKLTGVDLYKLSVAQPDTCE